MKFGNVPTDSIADQVHIVKVNTEKVIPVSVHIPENVSANIRQQKINKIYGEYLLIDRNMLKWSKEG